MRNLTIIVLLVAALLVFAGVPRVRTYFAVGRESLVDTIDAAIGEFRVKRAEVAEGIERLKESEGKLRRGQIRCEVKAEQLAKELTEIDDKNARAFSSLGTLRELIAAGEPAVLGGREYSVAQLQVLAEDVISLHKSLKTQYEGIGGAKVLLDETAKTLLTKLGQAQSRIFSMENQLREIDAKIMALDTMRGAAGTTGSSGETLAANFKDVQNELNDLYVQVETELRIEEEDWKGSLARESDVEQFIQGSAQADSTLDRINSILGK